MSFSPAGILRNIDGKLRRRIFNDLIEMRDNYSLQTNRIFNMKVTGRDKTCAFVLNHSRNYHALYAWLWRGADLQFEIISRNK